MGFGFKYFLLVFLLGAQLALADSTPSLLKTLENQYFYNYENQRFGLEIEYTNVSLDESIRIAQEVLGGKIESSLTREGMEVRTLRGGAINNFKIKVETNQTGESISAKSEWVYEIVGPPLTFEQNLLIQKVLDRLKQAGAKGSENGTPVSIQTNTEMKFKTAARYITDADVEFEFKVLRNFYINHDQIMSELSPVDSRLKYIQPLSPGMMKRLLDPTYQPKAKQILNDYIYRQSLELLGNSHAWTMHISDVKKIIYREGFPIVRRVVKLNSYRFSSMLMYRFPHDPYFAKYKERTWTFSAPITEQRARNNDFNVASSMKQIVALRNATEKHGLFKFNAKTGEFQPLKVPALLCYSLFH